jgi:ubiquinone/menaquinone biosynthesis C-methylase UbiE
MFAGTASTHTHKRTSAGGSAAKGAIARVEYRGAALGFGTLARDGGPLTKPARCERRGLARHVHFADQNPMSTQPLPETPNTRGRHQDVLERVGQYWDLRSPAYDAGARHGLRNELEHRAWLTDLAALMPPSPSDVLDVGTGTGFLALLLAQLGHRVTGVDIATGMLALAREKAAGLRDAQHVPDFREGDAGDPQLPAASFDAVVSRHVLWTLPDLVGSFAAWRRLLRPGGRVVAIDGLWKLPVAPRSDGGTPTAAPPATPSEASQDWRELWAQHYSAEVQARLPLFNAATLDPAMAAAREAGYVHVSVSTLAEVERVEREIEPDAAVSQPRYVLTARLP